MVGSRKFILACTELAIVTIFAGYGILEFVESTGGVVAIIGSWAGTGGVILKMYNSANVASKKANGG